MVYCSDRAPEDELHRHNLVGFELRRLTGRDDLIGVAQGYGYAALAATGPWLCSPYR